jgi:glycosyltransferase involved in cell wall biosynthesis
MPFYQKKNKSDLDKQQIIFLGKLPPPYIGPSVACEIIINSKLKDEFNLIHLDTSDHRDINTLGKIDFGNIYYALKQYFLLIKYLLKYRDAIVYVPAGQTTVGYIRDAVFIVIAKFFRRKVITHLRGGNFLNWYNKAPGYARWIVRRVHPKIDAQIVLGNNLRALFNWIIPNEKIHVIPNGGNYDVPFFQRKSNKVRILFLGNLIGTKGVLEVLHASEYLKDLKDKIEFVFAGEWRDEPTKSAFLQFIQKFPGLPITIAGAVNGNAKFKLLASCDIFTFPTYYPNEGHPWVIVEAMSASLPIISTDHAAISESVIDGRNGFLVEKKNAKNVAEKIRYLIEHTDVRNQMGQESRKLYLENFTKDIMIQKLGDVFRKVAVDK